MLIALSSLNITVKIPGKMGENTLPFFCCFHINLVKNRNRYIH
jgi:hypothetical protein